MAREFSMLVEVIAPAMVNAFDFLKTDLIKFILHIPCVFRIERTFICVVLAHLQML